jgi:hypothetical protein
MDPHVDDPALAAEPRPKPKAKPRPARTFTEFVHARRTNRDPFRPPDNKLWARKVAEACGVGLPELYGVFGSPAEIPFADLPERVVLKPTSLTDRRGVFLLERREAGYFDRISGTVLGAAGIVDHLGKLLAKFPRRPTTVIAEELVETETPIPIDYKLFVFGGEVSLIEHINRNTRSKRVLFYDGAFRPMDVEGKIKLNFRLACFDRPRPPRHPEAMVAAARRLARHIETPFTRIDFYAGRQGPVLGEITPTPGGAYFGSTYRLTDRYDAELGGRWAAAAEALGQPAPRITGRAPIRERARQKVSIGALELRDLKSDLRALEIEKRRLEQRLAAIEARSPLWRMARPLGGFLRRLGAFPGRGVPAPR